jgi:tetratricopeptide (TPR) repeat protein
MLAMSTPNFPVSSTGATPLPAIALPAWQRGRQALQRHDYAGAERDFAAALHAAPGHPELLRARAFALSRLQRHGEAIGLLREALAATSADGAALNELGTALAEAGDMASAEAAFRRACAAAPTLAAAWFNLGRSLREQARVEDSLEPLQRALALDPALESAHFLLAETLMMLGRTDASAAQYRALLRHAPRSGLAWWGLANLKATRLNADDVARLDALARRADLPLDEAIAARFARAKALEDGERHADAWAAYVDANALARRRFAWSATGFRRWLDGVLAAFAAPLPPVEPALGHEVIFVVGMPRSGSTLTEQILAAHPQVEGGSELPDLGVLIGEESRRRGQPFPAWVGQASAADWQRLGRAYLERTAQWRARRPRFTDKTPGNWMLVGAIRAMLPGARIIDCRRDALETCWSCFRQIFWAGHEYSYGLDDLAAYHRDYTQAMRQWQARHPAQIRTQVYEELVADAEAQTRALLAFCGLPFEPACLRFFEAERSVRTASAAQVRQPLRRDTARAPRYGALLDPLRAALARHAAD